MSDMAMAMVATKQALTQHTAQLLMVKKNHEMDMMVVDMLAQAVENAPKPEGMGTRVDKTA